MRFIADCQFFTSPKKKVASGSTTPAEDMIEVQDDDDEEEELVEDDFRPSSLAEPSSTTLGKRKAEDYLLGPVCPICAKALGPTTSNQGLNDHIDRCLNKDAIYEASKRTPKKVKKGHTSNAEKGGSMLSWLNKARQTDPNTQH